MKLSVKNLGRIRDADIPIKPLTVFIGPNNTNKTWTAYALNGLLHDLSLRAYVLYFFPLFAAELLTRQPEALTRNIEQQVAKLMPSLQELGRVTQTTTTTLPPESAAPAWSTEIARADLLRGLSDPVHFQLTKAALARVLALPEDHFRETEVRLELSLREFASGGVVDRLILTSGPPLSPGGASPVVQLLGINRQNRAALGYTLPLEMARDPGALSKTLKDLACGLYFSIVPFPAERKALTSLYRLLDESLRRLLQITGPNLPGFTSLPVATFFSMLRLLDAYGSAGKAPSSEFTRLSDLLERRILKGNLLEEPEDPAAPLAYRPEGMTGSLTMHASSSLVRALAGLDLYLRRFATPQDFLIVDEPEMNAHPESQLAITELLALLANTGLWVTLTTHSPYIVDHLTNLVEASKLSEPRQQALQSEFKLQSKDAFVSPDKVAVYFFSEDGEVQVRDVFDRDTATVDWSTFSRQSDYVARLYNMILSQEARGE